MSRYANPTMTGIFGRRGGPAAPSRSRVRPTRDELEAAVRKYGYNTTSYVLLEGDKHYFSDPAIDGFVAYQIRARVAVIGGDPVCAPTDAERILTRFVAEQRRAGRDVCAYQVSEPFLPAFRAAGFSGVHIGSEAILDLTRFSLRGNAMLNVRAARNKARREGVVVSEVDPIGASDDARRLATEIEEVSERWLSYKGQREMGFLLGGLGLDGPSAKRYFVARSCEGEGRIEGFIVCEPIFGRNGYYLDVTRRRPDAIPGAMELLTVEICERFAREGVAMVSLGLAPLANLDDPELGRHPRLARAMRYVFEHGESVYGFRGLRWYKAKYQPHAWERRYLCVRGTRARPRQLYAAIMVRSAQSLAEIAFEQIGRRLPRARRARAKRVA